MKREHAIAYLRVAGYHGDSGSFVRLYVENRISYATAKEAFNQGANARRNGVGCTCADCKKAS